jgi:hypothetical protein
MEYQPTTVSIELVSGDSADDSPSVPVHVAESPVSSTSSSLPLSNKLPARVPLSTPLFVYVICAIAFYVTGLCVYKEYSCEAPYQSFWHGRFCSNNTGTEPVAVTLRDIQPGERFMAENVSMIAVPKTGIKYPVVHDEPLWGRAAGATIKAGTVIDVRSIRADSFGYLHRYKGTFVLVAARNIQPGDDIFNDANFYSTDEWGDKTTPTISINMYSGQNESSFSTRRMNSTKSIKRGTVIRPGDFEWADP